MARDTVRIASGVADRACVDRSPLAMNDPTSSPIASPRMLAITADPSVPVDGRFLDNVLYRPSGGTPRWGDLPSGRAGQSSSGSAGADRRNGA